MPPIPSNPVPQPIVTPSGGTPPPAHPVAPASAPGAELGTDAAVVGNADSQWTAVVDQFKMQFGKTLTSQDRAKLEAALQNGTLTREEFNAALGVSLDEETWNLLTSGRTITSMGDLLQCLQDRIAVPASGGVASTVNEVANLYRSLTGKTLSAEDLAKLEAAIASDGGLTREEFNEICRAHFTEEAWNAFTGGYGVTNTNGRNGMADLLYYLREFEDYSVATGNSFEYFAQCTEITISDELTSTIHSMSPQDLAAMCATHSDIASRVLGHITGSQIPDSRTQEEQGAEFDYTLAISMLSDQQRARFEKMMAAALLNDMNNYAERHGMDLDNLNLKDPLMSRMFGEQVFRAYATEGRSITEEDFNSLKETSGQIAKLREIVKDSGSGIDLDALDPRSPQFQTVLQMIEQGKSNEEILAALNEVPLMPGQTPAAYVEVGAPAAEEDAAPAGNPAPPLGGTTISGAPGETPYSLPTIYA